MATDLTLLGKVIGTFEAWDEVDESTKVFFPVVLNDIGMNFIGGNIEDDPNYDTVTIDTFHGIVSVEQDNVSVEIEKPNWSVFNKE